MPPPRAPERFARSTVIYDRWHWPTNRVWVPDDADELIQHCPMNVSFSTCSAALNAWEEYLDVASRVPLEESVIRGNGGGWSEAYARLGLFAQLHGLVDRGARTVPEPLAALRVEWTAKPQVEYQAVDRRFSWVRYDNEIRIVLPVVHRTVVLEKRIERKDDGWSRELIGYRAVTEWSDPQDRGWRMEPQLETVTQVWGDQPPFVPRPRVQLLRDEAKAEGWTQGQLAIQQVLDDALEGRLEFTPRRSE